MWKKRIENERGEWRTFKNIRSPPLSPARIGTPLSLRGVNRRANIACVGQGSASQHRSVLQPNTMQYPDEHYCEQCILTPQLFRPSRMHSMPLSAIQLMVVACRVLIVLTFEANRLCGTYGDHERQYIRDLIVLLPWRKLKALWFFHYGYNCNLVCSSPESVQRG